MSTPRKKKIGMVLDQRFPPDARVEREATALVNAGYEVHLLCEMLVDKKGKPTQAEEETYKGIFIHRVISKNTTFTIPGVKIKTKLPYKGFFKNINRYLWNLDTAWHALTLDFVNKHRIDVLHIHDLRLGSTGIAVANKFNIRIILDLHENYPALMAMLKGRDSEAKGRKAYKKWTRIERHCTFEADRIITVIEEAQERLLTTGIRPHKLLVLPNTVDTEKFSELEPDAKIQERYKGKFLLSYVGHINNEHRGIHTVIEAMGMLKKEIPNLFLVLAGQYQEAYANRLKKLITHHELEDHVELTGWLDETEFVTYIDAAKICLCPHLETEHTNTTFPNKVYLYHLLKKPVIVSSCAPLMRYIAETQGGAIFKAGDAEDLAEKIFVLYNQRLTRNTLGRRGQKAVLAGYTWQHVAPRIVNLYDQLLHTPKSALEMQKQLANL